MRGRVGNASSWPSGKSVLPFSITLFRRFALPVYTHSMQRLPALLLPTVIACLLSGAEWPQFRGLNASGVSEATNLPVEFGPAKNVIWKTALPAGHSSPVLTADRIFVTAFDAA